MPIHSKNVKKVSIEVKSIKAQGPRPSMEDNICIQSIGENLLMLAVFDGHGGADVANMCVDRAPVIMKRLVQSNPEMSICLRLLYKELDEEARLLNVPQVGSTAVIVIVTQDRIWFSNCGDAMAAIKTHDGKVRYMSQDHKVENEVGRIEALGGVVTRFGGCARIYGTLNIARSIGDHYLKAFVTSDPYVTATSFPKADIDWVIIASDGLWDVYEPDELSRDLVAHKYGVQEMTTSAYSKGSMDNISIIYSKFTPI